MDYAMKCRICVGANLQDNVLVPSGEMVADLNQITSLMLYAGGLLLPTLPFLKPIFFVLEVICIY